MNRLLVHSSGAASQEFQPAQFEDFRKDSDMASDDPSFVSSAFSLVVVMLGSSLFAAGALVLGAAIATGIARNKRFNIHKRNIVQSATIGSTACGAISTAALTGLVTETAFSGLVCGILAAFIFLCSTYILLNAVAVMVTLPIRMMITLLELVIHGIVKTLTRQKSRGQLKLQTVSSFSGVMSSVEKEIRDEIWKGARTPKRKALAIVIIVFSATAGMFSVDGSPAFGLALSVSTSFVAGGSLSEHLRGGFLGAGIGVLVAVAAYIGGLAGFAIGTVMELVLQSGVLLIAIVVAGALLFLYHHRKRM